MMLGKHGLMKIEAQLKQLNNCMNIINNKVNYGSHSFFLVFLLLTITSCIPSQKPFFPGEYHTNDRIYENKSIGFSMVYKGSWNIMTTPKSFTPVGKKLAADLARVGAELLFMGATVENTQGTRAIAAHLNLTPLEYAQKIRETNRGAVSVDSGLADFAFSRTSGVTWEYWTGGFHFIEYFFKINTYNVRISFWARDDIYNQFLPIYQSIIYSLEIVTSLDSNQ